MTADRGLSSSKPITRRTATNTEQAASQGPESEALPLEAVYSPALLGKLGGRGAGPVQATLMRRLQQSYGNQAVQRLVQRVSSESTPRAKRVAEEEDQESRLQAEAPAANDLVSANSASTQLSPALPLQRQDSRDVEAAGSDLEPNQRDHAPDAAMPSVVVVQRDPPDTAAAPAASTLPMASQARQSSENLRTRAAARVAAIALYDAQANLAFRAFQPKRMQISRNYRTAFENHVNVLGQAQAAAERQNMIQSVVIGAVASAVVGIAAAAILPAAVVSAAALSAATITSVSVQGAISSVGGTVISNAVSTDTGFDAQGSADEDEMDAWRTMANLQSQARQVSTFGAKFGMHLGNTEYAIAQVNAHLDGGTPDMSWNDTVDMLVSLQGVDRGTAGLDAPVAAARGKLEELQRSAEAMEVPSPANLETQIWIAWISGLTNPDLLDRDAIEDHLHLIGVLGPSSLLGVDFGRWTSDADEQEAISAARAEVSRLEEARRAAAPSAAL